VTVIHGTLLTAVHAHPAVAVTDVVNGPPTAGEFCEVAETLKAQVDPVNENVFDRLLRAVPPGPTAATSAM
jgi:hypothetical protein